MWILGGERFAICFKPTCTHSRVRLKCKKHVFARVHALDLKRCVCVATVVEHFKKKTQKQTKSLSKWHQTLNSLLLFFLLSLAHNNRVGRQTLSSLIKHKSICCGDTHQLLEWRRDQGDKSSKSIHTKEGWREEERERGWRGGE